MPYVKGKWMDPEEYAKLFSKGARGGQEERKPVDPGAEYDPNDYEDDGKPKKPSPWKKLTKYFGN